MTISVVSHKYIKKGELGYFHYFVTIEYFRSNIEYLRPARLALLTVMSSGRMATRMAGVVFFRFKK